jgi:hypothetical protein
MTRPTMASASPSRKATRVLLILGF